MSNPPPTATFSAEAQASAPPHDPPPRLAEGVEMIGEYEGSGFKETPYIARRADGQTLQLTRLLYSVAASADGQRDHAAIARTVSDDIGRKVSPDNVRFLVEKKLRPLGVLATADGSSPELERPDPLLALKFRTSVVPERVTHALTAIAQPLFWPPVLGLMVAGFLALDAWLFLHHGIAQGFRHAIYEPLLLLAMFAGVVVASAFHELGHATACRYGGARPGAMGVGIYIVWPAFYTDVTDAYRLSRGGRLRTDLGGIYFNAIFALAMGGLYALTSSEPLLLLVLIQNVAMLQQLLPFLRLDGYYILSDLTGVPDMLSRIRPVLRSLKPGAHADPRVTELKPWVRVVVTAYVLGVVPLLAISLLMALLHAPRLFATAYDSLGARYDEVAAALDGGAALSVASSSLQLLMLALPALGLALTFSRVGRRAGTTAWSWSEGRPERRAVVVSAATAAVALTAFTWWPNGDYRPIQPGERGTIQSGLRSIAAIPGGRPSVTPEREHELRRTPSARRLDRPQEGRTPAVETQRPVRRRAAKRARKHRDATPTPTAPSAPASGGTADVTDAVSGATDGVTDTATGQTDAATRSVPAVPTVTVPAVPTAVPTVSAPGLP
jgi:putative peptide zinc metalloprotease protein